MTGSIHKKPKSSQHRKDSKQPDLFKTGYSALNNKHHRGHAVMYCDGASRGNPGKSGIGIAINLTDENTGEKRNYRISEYIGIATNNVAEYSALIKGLEKAKSLGIRKIIIFLDSELLVRQINGIYKVKNKNLIPLWIQANNLLKYFDSYTITHVPREMNVEADSLAGQAIKKADLK
jgi:ribonuclease HI